MCKIPSALKRYVYRRFHNLFKEMETYTLLNFYICSEIIQVPRSNRQVTVVRNMSPPTEMNPIKSTVTLDTCAKVKFCIFSLYLNLFLLVFLYESVESTVASYQRVPDSVGDGYQLGVHQSETTHSSMKKSLIQFNIAKVSTTNSNVASHQSG